VTVGVLHKDSGYADYRTAEGVIYHCEALQDRYLDEYIAAAGIAGDKDGPLFRTTGRSTGTPHRMTATA
jgi:hypothetical protein